LRTLGRYARSINSIDSCVETNGRQYMRLRWSSQSAIITALATSSGSIGRRVAAEETLMNVPRPLSLAAVCVTLVASVATGQTRTERSTSVVELSSALERSTQAVVPAVVDIFATAYVPAGQRVDRQGDLVSTERASGSGVIVDAGGYIVTNAHVVRGARQVRVELPAIADGQSILEQRGRTLTGRIVGIDDETDLAVLKVDATALPFLPFGDSDELKAGQLVLAIGSANGLRHSVSLGVISSVARQLEPESPMVYVQTDAAINPGSSGGALVDVRGRLIGINTLILSRSGGYEGLGFAAPSNIVRTVYEQIRRDGHVARGDIGVRPLTIDPALAAGLGLARDHGVVLADVLPRSDADKSRIASPVIWSSSLDGKPMENGRQLRVGLYRHVPGDVVTLEVLRDGATRRVSVLMTHRREVTDLTSEVDPRQNLIPRLGILGVDLNPSIAEMLPVLRVRAGVVVVVDRGRCARHARRRAGDGRRDLRRQPDRRIDPRRIAVGAGSPEVRRSCGAAAGTSWRADVSGVHRRLRRTRGRAYENRRRVGCSSVSLSTAPVMGQSSSWPLAPGGTLRTVFLRTNPVHGRVDPHTAR
jgi:serine protease Do